MQNLFRQSRRAITWIVLSTFLANLFGMPLAATAATLASNPFTAQYLGEWCSAHADAAADPATGTETPGTASASHCTWCANAHGYPVATAIVACGFLRAGMLAALPIDDEVRPVTRPWRQPADPRAPPAAA